MSQPLKKEKKQLPFVDLKNYTQQQLPLHLLPMEMMLRIKVIPIEDHSNRCTIAVADSNHPDIASLSFYVNKPIRFVQANQIQIEELLRNLKLLHNTESLNAIKNSEPPLKEKELYELSTEQEEPLIRFINHLLEKAIRNKASDIHFEIYETTGRVRFRQDGILHEITQTPLHVTNRLVTRLKIMSKLNIAEHRKPQDGHCQVELNHEKINMRTSCCPTQQGEKIVLRILDNQEKKRNIENIGLNESQYNNFLQALNQPQGLILVTGPTGSGKTVTLYAALQHLNCKSKNILTIEDPIEIALADINQVNINPPADLTFSTALRAFLRQDPDIIMVGEIRDTETAEIAIKAAQTGHLVLSTLHTNSATQAISRLENMGIARYNIMSSLTLVTAQRLIRKLCPLCKKETQTETALTQHLKLPKNFTYFESVGCEKCHSGYSGRVAIHEVLKIESPKACISLQQNAINAIKKGITSFEEIQRVIGFYEKN